MRTTGYRKKANSSSSAGTAGHAPDILENMDVLGIDRDVHPRAGRRQLATRRLAHDQLEAVVAGDAELEGAAEIDRFLDLAREDIGAAAETLGPHQDAHALADLARMPGEQPPAAFERDDARLRHGAAEDVALAHEVRDERIRGPFVDLGRRGDLFDAALVHHGDTVGKHQRFFLIVRDEDRGEAKPALQAADLELHGLAQLAVEGAERLVEQQQTRIEDDGAGQRHPLLLATG